MKKMKRFKVNSYRSKLLSRAQRYLQSKSVEPSGRFGYNMHLGRELSV